MFQPPSSFSAGTSHRLVHFFDQPWTSDHERIEDILANVTRDAREALEALHELPFERFVGWRHDLTKLVRNRTVLSGDFRNTVRRGLQDLAEMDPGMAEDEHSLACRMLRGALENSLRVADLLAAESEIAKHRTRDI